MLIVSQKMAQKEGLKKLSGHTKIISVEFHEVFEKFWNGEIVYGFGGSQLKSLYDKVMHYR